MAICQRILCSQHHLNKRLPVIDNCKSLYFWRAVFVEFLGTFLLLTIACGSCLPIKRTESLQIRPFEAAITAGLTISVLIWSLGHISGGHFNPAVSLAHLAVRRMSLVRFIFYSLAQIAGATLGELMLMVCVFPEGRGKMSVLDPHTELEVGQAILVEIIATYIFVLNIFATCNDERPGFVAAKPFVIGSGLASAVMFSAQLTGGALNPARAFGPAWVNGVWQNQWIYWLGPHCGALLAALTYEFLFNSRTSLFRAKAMLTSRRYDPDAFESADGKDLVRQYPLVSNDANANANTELILRQEKADREIPIEEENRAQS